MHLEQTVSAGTTSIAPVTINKLPVYISGIPTPTIQDSAFAQADSGHQIIVGVSASVNAGQVATKPVVVIGEGSNAWGDGAIAIGKSVQAGVNAARDGAICIGDGTATDAKNGIRIGSALAFGSTLEDWIAIGTQAVASRGIAIGKAAANAGLDGLAFGTSASNGEGSSVAIGKGANTPNSGLGTPNKNIAIGDGASCQPTFSSGLGGVIAIGPGASNTGQNTTALGPGASIVGANVVASIAIGAGATSSLTSECAIGNNTFGAITLFSVWAGAGVRVKHRSGGAGGWGIRDNANANDIFAVDEDATAGNARLFIWDCATGLLKRVTFGAGAGVAADAANKYLRVVV